MDGGVRSQSIASRTSSLAGAWERIELIGCCIAQSPGAASVVTAILYLALTLASPPGGYFISDQGGKFIQIDTLARTGSLDLGKIEQPASIHRREFTGSTASGPVGDHYESVFPVAYAAVVMPFYRILGAGGMTVPSMLGSLMAAYFVGRAGLLLGLRWPGLLTMTFGLASPIFFYALVLWEHALSVGFVSLALFLALGRRPLNAGLSLGAAFWFRPESLLFSMALSSSFFMVYGVRDGLPYLIRLSVGTCIAACPIVLYNLVRFGTLFGPQVSANPSALSQVSANLSALSQHITERSSFVSRYTRYLTDYLVPQGQRKWALLLGAVLAVYALQHQRRRPLRVALALLYAGCVVVGVLGVLQGGLAVSNVLDAFPFALATLSGLPRIRADRRLAWIGLASLGFGVVAIVLAPSSPSQAGGWGPRYLLPLYPPLAVLAWAGFCQYRDRLLVASMVILLAFSVAVQAMGVYHLHREQTRWSQLEADVASLKPAVIVTSLWWLPRVVPATVRDARWYGVVNHRDLEDVAGVENSFWWIWSDESTYRRPLDQTGVLSLPGFMVVEERSLSTRGLRAARYTRSPS